MAPPEPPSPMITEIIGTVSERQQSVERAMASAWPRSSARCQDRRPPIHKADDGDAEAIRHLHEPHRLAVALGLGHAEIVLKPALRVGALLVAHNHDRAAMELARARPRWRGPRRNSGRRQAA